MVVIHRAFRRESRLLASLIAAVPDGDTRRAAVLAAHLRWYQRGLHNHHVGEDELLWPVLHARADVESGVVLRMEAQHERVAASLDQVMLGLPAWQASARIPERDRLAAALSDVFCLGRVIVFAASGSGPFAHGPQASLLYRVVHSTPAITEVPGGLRGLAAGCLAKRPADRPTMAELQAAMARAPELQPDCKPGPARWDRPVRRRS